MEKNEISELLKIAEDDSQPLYARRGVMDRLSRIPRSLELEPHEAHRLEKVRHRVRREMEIALHTDS